MKNEYTKYLDLMNAIGNSNTTSDKVKNKLLDLVTNSMEVFNTYAEALIMKSFLSLFPNAPASAGDNIKENFRRSAAQLHLINQLCDEFGCEHVFTGNIFSQAEVEQFIENIRMEIFSSEKGMFQHSL